MEAAAVDGMTSDMARWIGILIRCGHARCHSSNDGNSELYLPLAGYVHYLFQDQDDTAKSLAMNLALASQAGNVDSIAHTPRMWAAIVHLSQSWPTKAAARSVRLREYCWPSNLQCLWLCTGPGLT